MIFMHIRKMVERRSSAVLSTPFYMYFSWSSYCVPKVGNRKKNIWSRDGAKKNLLLGDPKMPPPSPPPFWSNPKIMTPVYLIPWKLEDGRMNENFEYVMYRRRPKNLHWELMNWNEWTKVKEGTSIISTV